MWINKNKTEKYICPDENLELIFNAVKKWNNKTKNRRINLWIDSKYTNEIAIENTKKLIKNFQENGNLLKIKDVRKINKVKENREIFDKSLPVYFRVDLLRFIITLDQLKKEKAEKVVYADLDMKDGLSKKELFDNETMENLKKFGIVLAREGDFF